jgi:hypothetical protein
MVRFLASLRAQLKIAAVAVGIFAALAAPALAIVERRRLAV